MRDTTGKLALYCLECGKQTKRWVCPDLNEEFKVYHKKCLPKKAMTKEENKIAKLQQKNKELETVVRWLVGDIVAVNDCFNLKHPNGTNYKINWNSFRVGKELTQHLPKVDYDLTYKLQEKFNIM